MIGTIKLSLNFMEEISSLIVITSDAHRIVTNEVLENVYIIKKVVIRNAIDPSSDFFNSFVFPYLMPIIAADESDKLTISNAMKATFSLNMIIHITALIKTHDAPVRYVASCGRAMVPNSL